MKRSMLVRGALGLAVAPAVLRKANAQSFATVRLGTTATDLFAQPLYARDQGFFQKAGLDVEVRTFPNVPPIAAAVAGGDLDIGAAVPISVANASARGVPLVIIGAGAVDTAAAPANLLCVAPNSPIRNAKDLEGKTIGVSGIKSLSDLSLDTWLAQHGADPTKVARVELIQPQMTASIVRGAVAAALLAEPAHAEGRKSDGIQTLGDPTAAIGPRVLMSCWFTTTSFAQKNPEVIRAFQAALRDASRWANAHHADSAAILAKYTKIDGEVLRAMGRCAYADQLQPSDLQPELDAALKFGMTPKAINASDLFLS